MVTKLRYLAQSQPLSVSFEYNPNTTTGLSFGHFGGTVYAEGARTNIAAGTVTVPAGTSYVYLDQDADPALLVAEVTVTSTRYIPLYQVTAAGGVITDVVDLRGIASFNIGPDV